jgi:hypothetical protein
MVLGDCSWNARCTLLLSGPQWNADSRNSVLVQDSPTDPDVPEIKQAPSSKGVLSTQTFTLLVGVLVVVFILFCNNWIIKAQSVFSSLERVTSAFDSFDHTDLVAMVDLCDLNEEAASSDLARLIRIGKTIQIHDALLAEAQDTALDLSNKLEWPSFGTRDQAKHDYEALGQMGDWGKKIGGAGVPENPAETSQTDASNKIATYETNVAVTNGASDANEAFDSNNPKTEKDMVCESFLSNPSDLIQQYRVWRTSLKGFSETFEISRTQPMFTGKGPGTNLILEHRLRAKLTIVTLWWLPILNGALGAIIFCLTRLLNDKSNAPKFAEIVLRMVFGGFAGLLVSTLLLPSGVAFGQFAGNAPGVSLLAFIFGFSLDSFIQLLERLNQLVIESVSSKKTDK